MTDADLMDEIEQLVRTAPTLRDLVGNTVLLAGRIIDYERYVREKAPTLVLTGLTAAERFDQLAEADGWFQVAPELPQDAGCFYFSVLGHAHDLFVALPGLTDAELERRVSRVMEVICEFPEAYLPQCDPAEQATDPPVDDLDDGDCLRQLFANALIWASGWFEGTYAPSSEYPPSDDEYLSAAEAIWLAAEEKRYAQECAREDAAHMQRGGSCNFVMAD